MRFPKFYLPLFLCLILLPPFASAQSAASPAGDLYRYGNKVGSGVYLGEGLFLTSLRAVLAEALFTDENGEIPLYAQGWAYDADGSADYGEDIFGQFVCTRDQQVTLEDTPADSACIPYDLTQLGEPMEVGFGGDVTFVRQLIYADRRFDLAIIRLEDVAAETHAASLNAVPLDAGTPLFTAQGERLTLRSTEIVRLWTDRAAPSLVKLPYAAPYQAVEVQIGRGETLDSLEAGAAIFNDQGEVVGMTISVDGDQVYFAPAAVWLDDLLAAAEQLQVEALDRAKLPAQVAGAETIGDPYTPELGNSGIDVEHYSLILTADPRGPSISGTAELTLTVTQPNLASFTLDLRQLLSVSAVRVGGAPAQFEQGERKLRIFLPQPQPYGARLEVAIDYGGWLDDVPSPYFPYEEIGAAIEDTPPRFAIIAQPDAANTWFPCNDHPLDTATYTFRITVAQPYEAVANGQLIKVTTTDQTTTFEWDMPFPMASYLALLAVADYSLVEETAPNNVPLYYYLYADTDPQIALASFGQTSMAMEILEKYFGAYPFASYGQVITPMEGGALETQTMSAMPASMMQTDDSYFAWTLIVHELAHQWFGDAVRLGVWQDIWLNEGFATLAEWLANEDRYGESEGIALRSWGEEAIIYDERPTPLAYPTAAEMFSNDSYQKGGWVLHMLRLYLGDEVFFPMIQAYAAAFRQQPATTEAFFQFAERFSGQELTRFRWQWLEQPFYPQFLLYWKLTEAGAEIRLCSGRAEQRYWIDLPLQFSGESGEQALVTLKLNADEMDEAAAQNMDAAFDLPFIPQELTVDPQEAVLEEVEPIFMEVFPPCEF